MQNNDNAVECYRLLLIFGYTFVGNINKKF